MDLTFGKEELAFQQEVRDWLKDNFTPEMQGELKVSRNAYLPKEKLIDWQKRLAEGVRRPGLHHDAEVHLRDGDGEGRRARHLAVRAQDVRAGDHEIRLGRAEEAASAADAELRPDLVPGLLGAGFGLGPRLAPDEGRARGRLLHRQRPEDLDDAGADCRLDLLSRAHLDRGQTAGGHLLPADRHEDAGHPRRSDHHRRRQSRRHAGGQLGVLHRREGAGVEPRRRGEQGLDLRQVPARVRARRQSLQPAPALGLRAPEAAGERHAGGRGLDPVRSRLAREARPHGHRDFRARDVRDGVLLQARLGPESRSVVVDDQAARHRGDAAGPGVRRRGSRLVLDAVPRAARLERQCRADRSRGRRRAGAALLQRPQDDDLRRLVRGAAGNHVESDARPLGRGSAAKRRRGVFSSRVRTPKEKGSLRYAPFGASVGMTESKVMDLAFNAEELAFQKEVRDWITANMPPEVAEESRRSRSSHVSKERLLQWQKKLSEKGWLVPNWPKEYGGTGWSSTQKFIFEMEMARADSPYLSSFSLKMVAPVLMKYGSDWQKKRFRPRSCGARATPSRARAPTSRRFGPAPSGRATITSSTARRSGPPTPIGRTGCSAWCAPRTRASGRRESPSC